MSFLKNILGVFVELEDYKEVKKDSVSSQKDNAATIVKSSVEKPSNTINLNTEPIKTSTTNSYSFEEYQQHFEELIQEANQKYPVFQGTDFKEFMDSKTDVEAITDEAAKYRTAFNVLKRTGLTKEKLVTTAREYINVIDKDLEAFESAYNQQYRMEVEQKEQQLKHKTEELQMLSNKIAALNNELKQISQEVIKSKNQLTTNKSAFVLAGENKKKEIQDELQKINQYF